MLDNTERDLPQRADGNEGNDPIPLLNPAEIRHFFAFWGEGNEETNLVGWRRRQPCGPALRHRRERGDKPIFLIPPFPF